jgi:hypothetical protein
MKFLALLVLPLLLMGNSCQTTQLVRTEKPLVITVPENMYQCAALKKFKTDNLTDIEISKIIIYLTKNNITCYDSQQAIKDYLDKAKKEIEAEN